METGCPVTKQLRISSTTVQTNEVSTGLGQRQACPLPRNDRQRSRKTVHQTTRQCRDTRPATGWLLPEHGVTNPNQPGKLRRVSNAKSRYRGVCLNDMLLTGPDLLCNLLGVVCRFREKRYPISADIKGMYMQVSVRPDDRKFLRFLWGTDRPDFYEYTRLVFGAKCSPTCAIYALRMCADDNVNTHPHIRDIVYNNFYMDDFF